MTEPLPPLLGVVFDALQERGWNLDDGNYIDPEGNTWHTIQGAISAQTMREIAAAGNLSPLAARESDSPPEEAPYTVACSMCGAKPGNPCVTTEGKPMNHTHTNRHGAMRSPAA